MVRFFIHVSYLQLFNKFFLFLHIYVASIFFITDMTFRKTHTRKDYSLLGNSSDWMK